MPRRYCIDTVSCLVQSSNHILAYLATQVPANLCYVCWTLGYSLLCTVFGPKGPFGHDKPEAAQQADPSKASCRSYKHMFPAVPNQYVVNTLWRLTVSTVAFKHSSPGIILHLHAPASHEWRTKCDMLTALACVQYSCGSHRHKVKTHPTCCQHRKCLICNHLIT